MDAQINALKRAQMDADLKRLNFPCETRYAAMPTDALVKNLNDALDHDGPEAPAAALACALKTATARGSANKDLLLLYGYAFSGPHPAFAAYFLTLLERDYPGTEDRLLANLYADGRGVPQDTARATHMLSLRDGKIRHSLDNAQFEWVASLCSQTDEELLSLAGDFSRSGDVYDRIIARNINRHLRSRKFDEKVRAMNKEDESR